jgi:hypothetical protein
VLPSSCGSASFKLRKCFLQVAELRLRTKKKAALAHLCLEVEFPCELKPVFETALDHESEDQLGTFSEITLDKKSQATVPLSEI